MPSKATKSRQRMEARQTKRVNNDRSDPTASQAYYYVRPTIGMETSVLLKNFYEQPFTSIDHAIDALLKKYNEFNNNGFSREAYLLMNYVIEQEGNIVVEDEIVITKSFDWLYFIRLPVVIIIFLMFFYGLGQTFILPGLYLVLTIASPVIALYLTFRLGSWIWKKLETVTISV